MNIHQWDIFRVSVKDGIDTTIIHPHVVIQDDTITQSRIETVVVCALSTNMKRVNDFWNILLEPGEANLPKHSIIIVSQISTVQKAELGEYIGTLSKDRIDQIFAEMKLVQKMSKKD